MKPHASIRAGFAAAIVLLFPMHASPETGDYFYASGRRHELTRLPGTWAVHSPGGARRAGGAGEAWPRHDLVIVRGDDPEGAAQTALGPSARPRFATPVFDYGGGEPLVVTDELIAAFPPALGDGAVAAAARAGGCAVVRPLACPPRAFLLRAEGGNALAAAAALVESGGAVFAQPNFIARKRLRLIPDDPYFPHQWHLLNTGQGGALPGADIDAAAAWEITRGVPDAVIAVIDDGVDLAHEDLGGERFVPGYDFYDHDADPSAEAANRDWHGTAVTGAAAADGGNATGVSGAAPGCRVMPVRLVAGETSDEQDADAIRWAAEHGAWIISNSWGPPDGNPFIAGDERVYPLPEVVRAAIDYAADEGRGGKGCLIFWAAGNGNEPVGYDGYASYGKVIAVGACDDRGVKSYYSDYGRELDLCAPSDGGVTSGIWTTDFSGAGGYNPMSAFYGDAGGNYFSAFGGTSAATPLAAASAALLLSHEPSLTREEATARLLAGADRADPMSGSYGPDGHSDDYGFGRVNACSPLVLRTRHPRIELRAGRPSLRKGDALSLRFTLRAGRDEAQNAGDAYIMIVPPGGGALFVGPRLRISQSPVPFLAGIRAADGEGDLAPAAPLPALVPGRYTFYAAIVERGADPLDPASWRHTPAAAVLDFLP